MSIIEEIKDRIKLEDVVAEAAGVKLRRSGSSLTGFCPFHANHNTPSLVVWPGTQTWRCFGSCNEGGDVLDWVGKQNPGWEIGDVIKHLAGKAHIALEARGEDVKARVAARAKEGALKVAMRVFRRWLVGDEQRAGDAEALGYALDRGWTLETIKAAGIGFSGRASAAELKELRGELQLHGVDLESAEAVLVLGYQGDVRGWANRQGLEEAGFGEGQTRIMGFVDRPGLVYAHKLEGRIEYLSGRFLPGFDSDRKSHNPAATVAGPRRPYFNWLHGRHHALGEAKGSRVFIVEGQGDAVTWGQFGEAAMALCGSSWRYLVESGVVELLKREYEHIFYCTDADTPGELVVTGKSNDFPLAAAFGGGLWVLRMPRLAWSRNGKGEKSLKDVNDLAQYAMDNGLDREAALGLVRETIEKARPIVVLAAQYAGSRNGQVKDDAMGKVVRPLLVGVEPRLRVNYADELAQALYPSLGKTERTTAYNKWLNGELKKAKSEEGEDDELPEETTFGGWFPEDETGNCGWLLDIVLDKKSGRLRLVYAHITDVEKNVREVGTAPFVVIKGRKYVAPDYDEIIMEGVVKVATELGPQKNSGYLIGRMAEYYQRFFYLEDRSRYKFCASYALFTWVYDAFEALNYLRARGGTGSGKSDLMYLVGLTCYRFAVTLSTSTAAAYRGLAKMYKATIQIDEADDMMKRDDGQMNAFLKGRSMNRYAKSLNMMETMTPNGKVFVPSVTPVYGPTLITMYKSFGDAGIENRCVTFDLGQVDTITLDKFDMEPGYYPPELEEEGEELRNMCLRWRLENWLPKIELPKSAQGKRRKLADPLVSPRVSQVLRPMKVLAVLQGDEDLLNELTMVGRANYDSELKRRSSSFEAMVLRALLAVDIAADTATGQAPQASDEMAKRVSGYKDLFQLGKLGHYGIVRYVLLKNVAKVLNELMDAENLADGEEVDAKKKDKAKSKAVGDICTDVIGLPKERTGNGFAVILDRARLDLAKMRYGLDREAEYMATPLPAAPALAETPLSPYPATGGEAVELPWDAEGD